MLSTAFSAEQRRIIANILHADWRILIALVLLPFLLRAFYDLTVDTVNGLIKSLIKFVGRRACLRCYAPDESLSIDAVLETRLTWAQARSLAGLSLPISVAAGGVRLLL